MLSRFLPVLVLLCFAFACSDPLEDKRPSDPDPIIPDLEEKVNASIAGFITDENGDPVVFASVTAGDKQVLTDRYGYFSVSDASLSKFAGQVAVSSPDFFTAYKTFIPNTAEETFVRITLLEKPVAKSLDATAGGIITTDGATVQLQANSFIIASSGAAYTGEVKIYVRTLNPDEAGAQPGLPGDARGTDKDGYARTLQSYSPVVVELSTPGGQLLQLAGDKSATLTLPIAPAFAGTAPNGIALWTYNTSTGLWEEEGTAVKNGSTYVGTVTHFSFWDGATGVPMVNVTARIADVANQPLVHVPVRITLAGQPVNAGHGRFAFTDANGLIDATVFANKDFVLDILTPCATSAYSFDFSTAATDVDLGTLTGNIGQSAITLHGRAENCSGQGVTNGFVQTYDGGFFYRIPVVNGDFSFTGIMCTNTTINLVAIDLSTYKQNEPQEVTLVPGVNNTGTMTACGVSTMGHITYTYDGVTNTIDEPGDTIAAYSLDTFAGTQVITLSGEPNTHQQMAFQLSGEPETGTNTVTEVYSAIFPSGRGYWPTAITVTITEYGNPGGFVAGEFSSNLLDFADNSLHTFSCSFRIRRYR